MKVHLLFEANATIYALASRFFIYFPLYIRRPNETPKSYTTRVPSDSEVESTSRARKVHFSKVQEIIPIPKRSTKDRVWKPFARRLSRGIRRVVCCVCFPCIAAIRYCYNSEPYSTDSPTAPVQQRRSSIDSDRQNHNIQFWIRPE